MAKEKTKKHWRDKLDTATYKGFTTYIPFAVFISILGFIYITSNNNAVSILWAQQKQNIELQKANWRYLDLQSKLMHQTSESQLMNKSLSIGLKPLSKPVFEIQKINYNEVK